MRAKDVVLDAHLAMNFIEHSTTTRPEGIRHERLRILAEGNLVVAHGLYHGFGADPVAGCDLWRVEDDRIAEHWDAFQPWVAENPSGHSMTDGPTEIADRDKTDANRELVRDFVNLIMMGGDRSQLPRFFDGDRFTQHNPVIADGVKGLGGAIQAGVWAAVVERCDRVVAEGNFVFTQGEGTLAGRASAFYDLFRVESGKLAEHWDVVYSLAEPPPV